MDAAKNVDIGDFIREIKKLNTLWDLTNIHYHNNKFHQNCWIEIGTRFNLPAHLCKQKWKNLRDTFRIEHKKIQKLKKGSPDLEPKSTWSYYGDMLFLAPFMTFKEFDDNDSPSFTRNAKPKKKLKDPICVDEIKVEVDEDEELILSHNVIGEVISENNMLDEEPESEDIERYNVGDNRSDSFLLDDHNIPSQSTNARKRRYCETDLSETNTEVDDDDLLFFRSLLPFVKKLSDVDKLKFRMDVNQLLYNELNK